jgi:hypothetical protein
MPLSWNEIKTSETFPVHVYQICMIPDNISRELVKAHFALDKAVDLCYRPQPFINETKRIEFLFELYDKIVVECFGRRRRKN